MFSLSERYAGPAVKWDPLVDINAAVPSEELRMVLEEVLRKSDAKRQSPAGRKPIGVLVTIDDRRNSEHSSSIVRVSVIPGHAFR